MSFIGESIKQGDISVSKGLVPSRLIYSQIGALTGLRFFAALYVLIFHFGAGFAERAGFPEQVVNLLHHGYLGVSIFFILSGFILTYAYQSGTGSLKKYVVTRFARIYPVYFLALLIAAPLVFSQLDLIDVLKVLGMVQAWTSYSSNSGYTWIMQAWTLSVEIAFYILFPVLLRGLQRLSKNMLLPSAVLMSVIIVGAGTSCLAPGSLRPDLPYWMQMIPLPLLRLPEFVFGMIICSLFIARKSKRSDQIRLMEDILVVSILGLIVIILGTTKSQVNMLGLVTILFGLLIFLLATADGIIARMLTSRPLQMLGGASYAIYLMQGPIREWVRIIVPSSGIGQVLNPFLLIAISIAVFYGFEKPLRLLILSMINDAIDPRRK